MKGTHGKNIGTNRQQSAARANTVSTGVTSAKEIYQMKIESIMSQITAAFKCDEHDGRLCGKIRGSRDHLEYSNNHLLEHAKLIVSLLTMRNLTRLKLYFTQYNNIPGVKVDEVPEQLKALDRQRKAALATARVFPRTSLPARHLWLHTHFPSGNLAGRS